MIIDRTLIRSNDPDVRHCGMCGRPLCYCQDAECAARRKVIRALNTKVAPPDDDAPSGWREGPALL